MTGQLSLAEAHRRAQSKVAEFDGGRGVLYPEFIDEIFALAYGVESIHRLISGEMTRENADIWERISRKSASVA